MAQRYTTKDAAQCLRRLSDAAGFRLAKAWNDVGGLQLDCNTTYGGCVVQEVTSSGGGVDQPFGAQRRKPSEFCDAVSFTERVLYKRKSQGLHGASGKRKRGRK